MLDCRAHVGHSVTDVVRAAAATQNAIHGRLVPERRYQLDHRIAPATAHQTHRYVLNWIVEGAGDDLVVEERLIAGDRDRQIGHRDSNVMKFKIAHATPPLKPACRNGCLLPCAPALRAPATSGSFRRRGAELPARLRGSDLRNPAATPRRFPES